MARASPRPAPGAERAPELCTRCVCARRPQVWRGRVRLWVLCWFTARTEIVARAALVRGGRSFGFAVSPPRFERCCGVCVESQCASRQVMCAWMLDQSFTLCLGCVRARAAVAASLVCVLRVLGGSPRMLRAGALHTVVAGSRWAARRGGQGDHACHSDVWLACGC